MTTYQAETTVHVDPATLLMTRNIREAQPDPHLIKSVKDLGVIEPVVAVLTNDGALLVRTGHRRTLAAIEAGRTTVPVYIAGTDSTEKADEIVRVIAQRDENTHRAGLTTAEEVGVIETLTGLGLSAAQIAKRARIKRADVDTAQRVTDSKIARKALDRYESLTLDQAATVAEFEDDPETVKALVVAAHEGNFEHTAQRARDDRDREHAKTQVLASLEAAGITVIDRPGYDDKTTKELRYLAVSETDRARLTLETHTECPGHVAWLDSDWIEVGVDGNPIEYPDEPDVEEPEGDDEIAYEAYEALWEVYNDECARLRRNARRVQRPVPAYGCQGWKQRGHADPYGSGASTTKPKASDMSDAEREAAKAARKLVVENNKAWAAAQPVRRAWLATFAKSKTAPKGTAAFIATALSLDSRVLNSVGANHLAADWLGKKADQYGRADLSPAKSATDQRALVLALVQVLAGYEDDLMDHTWRNDGTHNAAGRYLRFIKTCGYGLSDVETYAMSKDTV